MVPRNVYSPGCLNTLFDATCGLAKASFSAGCTATTATDVTRTIFTTALGQAANYFALGWLVGTGGANNGVGRTVKAFASGVFTTVAPWPSPVTIGDTFTAFAGCDKKQATCNTKFSNLPRFRGQPWIPDATTVI